MHVGINQRVQVKFKTSKFLTVNVMIALLLMRTIRYREHLSVNVINFTFNRRSTECTIFDDSSTGVVRVDE